MAEHQGQAGAGNAALRVGVGLSTAGDAVTAAREAPRRPCNRPGWAAPRGRCVFSGDHVPHAEQLHEALVAAVGCEQLGGCSANGVIAQGQEVEGRPAVGVMVGDGPGLGVCGGIVTETGAGLARLGSFLGQSSAPAVTVLWPDSYRVDGATLLNAAAAALPRVPLFGAGASDGGMYGLSIQLAREGIHTGGASAMVFQGEMDVAVGITQSCAAVGDPHFITSAKEQILIELDGRPALQTLIDQGKSMGMETLQQVAEELLFGFPLDPEQPAFTGEQTLVRALGGFDQETHGLVVPYRLAENTTMGFMHRHPEVADADMARMVRQVAAQLPGPPDLALYFDCAARGQGFYRRPNVDVAHIRAVLGDVPLLGMFGGYELATALGAAHVYTFTGVLLLLRLRRGG